MMNTSFLFCELKTLEALPWHLHVDGGTPLRGGFDFDQGTGGVDVLDAGRLGARVGFSRRGLSAG